MIVFCMYLLFTAVPTFGDLGDGEGLPDVTHKPRKERKLREDGTHTSDTDDEQQRRR